MSRMADEMQAMQQEQEHLTDAGHREWVEANLEQEYLCEQALRECLSCGVSIENIQFLCQQVGVPYSHVVGDSNG